jgi:hypothetical protein
MQANPSSKYRTKEREGELDCDCSIFLPIDPMPYLQRCPFIRTSLQYVIPKDFESPEAHKLPMGSPAAQAAMDGWKRHDFWAYFSKHIHDVSFFCRFEEFKASLKQDACTWAFLRLYSGDQVDSTDDNHQIHHKMHSTLMHLMSIHFLVKILFWIFDCHEASDNSNNGLQESRRAKFVLVQYNGASLGGIAKSRAGINKPGKAAWTLCAPVTHVCAEKVDCSKHGSAHLYEPCVR